MRAYWSFAPEDAEQAFAEAARVDPNCAMAFWGRALALGNHMSNPVLEADCRPACGGPKAPNGERSRRGSCHRAQSPQYDRSANAQAAIDRALTLSNALASVDRALIEALALRISPHPEAPREPLLRAYAARMRDLWREHPDDADVGALFALALIDTQEGSFVRAGPLPKADIAEASRTLGAVLAKAPAHIGAAHILVHLLDRSEQAERALPLAAQLAARSPESGHLVHLYGHVLLRLRRSAEAAEQLRHALALADSGRADVQRLYRIHTQQLLLEAEMDSGQADSALATARSLVARVKRDTSPAIVQMLEGVGVAPSLVLVRFKRWTEVLAEPAPDLGEPVAKALWSFARVAALCRIGRVEAATLEQEVLATIRVDKRSVKIDVAKALAEAEIAQARGKATEAAAARQQAVQYQAALPDTLPHAWPVLELE